MWNNALMEGSASQQDIKDLRAEFKRELDKLWADSRDTSQRHTDEDDRRFAEMNVAIEPIKRKQDTQDGAVAAIKWVVGLPAVVAAVASMLQLIRHW